MIDNYDLNKYLPDFKTVFYDFSNDSNLKLVGDRKVRLTLKFFKISKIKDIKVVYQEIISFVISENCVDRDIFYLGVNYIADSREEFNYYILNERLKYEGMKKEADIVISAADKLRMKGERDLLKKQIKNKFNQIDNELIELIDTADINRVEMVAQIFYEFDDIEELKQQLKNRSLK